MNLTNNQILAATCAIVAGVLTTETESNPEVQLVLRAFFMLIIAACLFIFVKEAVQRR